VQSDQKIILGGWGFSISGQPSALLRLNPDGHVDQSFRVTADGGVQFVSIGLNGSIIVSGGFSQINGTPVSGIVRLLPNGRIDKSFALPPEISIGGRIIVEPDGALLLMDVPNRLRRLLPNGTKDKAFDQNISAWSTNQVVVQFA